MFPARCAALFMSSWVHFETNNTPIPVLHVDTCNRFTWGQVHLVTGSPGDRFTWGQVGFLLQFFLTFRSENRYLAAKDQRGYVVYRTHHRHVW